MTIKQGLRDALADGPKSLRAISAITGHDLESIRNAKCYLQADGVVQQVPGQKIGGARDVLFELVPVRQATHHGNVLNAPAWVPPKAMHRPVYHAPGMIVREKLTGRELCEN